MSKRQPIVSVLGHVDHGKTSLLDRIRGTSFGSGVAEREAGRITQHIGATEVPLDTVLRICGPLMGDTQFSVPGLLFIDTPGHHSFTTLRARGGSLADLAILVIDVVEAFKPQTVESLHILEQYRTPFIVAANKVDRINGWKPNPGSSFRATLEKQDEAVRTVLDEKLYKLIGKLHDEGFQSDRFDRVKDFSRSIGIVPISAKENEGIPDLLMILMGLAQRYLDEQLEKGEDPEGKLPPARGTVLEVKEVKGLGTTMDAIIYSGELLQDDTIVVGTSGEPIVTRVKAIMKPKPLDEIRDPREKFSTVPAVQAAAGVKIAAAQDLDGVVSGAPIRTVRDSECDDVVDEVRCEAQVCIELDEQGIVIKADTIGSLEALVAELRSPGRLEKGDSWGMEVPIAKASVGPVSRRDVVSVATNPNPLHRVVLAFNVKPLPDAKEELKETGVTFMESDIIYKLLEDYEKFAAGTRRRIDKEKRSAFVHPAKFKVLPDCIFRVSKPAVVGIRTLAGCVRPGSHILRPDGRVIGTIRSMREEEETRKECIQGKEVAIAISNVTVGRQIKGDDILYVDIPESDAKKLMNDPRLTGDEREVLDEVIKIKRKEKQFWGM
jgi:translation initiation factor 5B